MQPANPLAGPALYLPETHTLTLPLALHTTSLKFPLITTESEYVGFSACKVSIAVEH